MDMTKATDALSSRIGAFDGLGDDRPDHVLARAVLLVGDDDVVYVDDNLSRSLDGPGWSGGVLIFTAGRVIQLTLSQATDDAPGGDTATSVEATSWSRAGLRAVVALGADAAWDDLKPEDGMLEATGLRLTYADGQSIDVPSRWESGAGRASRESLMGLLPSLWADLAAGS
jgi:hypothetical protein